RARTGRPAAGGRMTAHQSRVIGLDLSLTSTCLACTCGIPLLSSHPSVEFPRYYSLRVIILGDLPRVNGAPLLSGRSKAADLVLHEIDNEATPYAVVAPTPLKKYVTGRGNASKDEVLAAAIRRWPDAAINGNDEADAYALRAMGLDHLGHPVADVPKTHREAL